MPRYPAFIRQAKHPVSLFFWAILIALGSLVIFKPEPEVPEIPTDKPRYVKTSFAMLKDWEKEGFSGIKNAFSKSCQAFENYSDDRTVGIDDIKRPAALWKDICWQFKILDSNDPKALRAFFKTRFEPYSVSFNGKHTGTFTGYYEPVLEGTLNPSTEYLYPVFGRPTDLIRFNPQHFDKSLPSKNLTGRVTDKGRLVPYHTREDIDSGAKVIPAQTLLWVKDPVDLFILHIQGSGKVALESGEEVRIGYADNNGHPFVSIGRLLLKEGLIERKDLNMPAMRKWMQTHLDEAMRVMQKNPRFIFFRMIDGEGPIGALGVPLTAERSLAVDPDYMPLGAPLWLETTDADHRPMRRMMVAQDIGAAIKGAVRGDFFWGGGDTAFHQAGRMKSSGKYFVLIPKQTAEKEGGA